MFSTPEDAVASLIDVVKTENIEKLQAVLGPDSQDLVGSSDPATARINRGVFLAAVAEGWQLVDADPQTRTLVIGNEGWPFPVPLTKREGSWRFDTAAGKEEVLDRRIGQNELAVIQTSRAFVAAEHRYAGQGHDGKPAGLYARTLRSDPENQNRRDFCPAGRGQEPKPDGDLVAQAASEGGTF